MAPGLDLTVMVICISRLFYRNSLIYNWKCCIGWDYLMTSLRGGHVLGGEDSLLSLLQVDPAAVVWAADVVQVCEAGAGRG